MPLPTFDKQADIPEAVRSGYVEKGGKWVPEIDDSALRESARRALDEKKQVSDRLEALLGGRKLEDVATILKGHETAEEERQRKAGEHDKILEKRLKEVRDEYEAKLKPLQESAEKLATKEFEEQVWTAAKKAGALDADRTLVLKAAREDFVRRDKAGKLIVVDEDGDTTGEDLEKLFTGRFKQAFPKLYGAAGGSGGGAAGGSGGKAIASGSIAASDNAGFLANVDKIASGEVKVVVGT